MKKDNKNNKIRIPRTMSTQHPDNVTIPFFAENSILSGDDEVKEAFFSYSNLSIDEQLWDVEGKEVDNHVVFKLLSKYPNYFKDHVLGKDIFLTIRCPNPEIEKTEAKILAELLSSITRNHDIASLFYKKNTTPIFEMVVPMCQSEEPLIMLREFYKKFIRDTKEILACGKSTQEWLGEFKPKDITVTPLFETKDEILNADKIVEKYIKSQKVKDYQRVWFARSDPALNYGNVSAILLVKIALQRIHKLEKKLKIPLYTIIGMGSSPFRGNFKPSTTKQILKGYPSIQTFTLQSAFKYDSPAKQVEGAINYINKKKRSNPLPINEKVALKYIDIIHKDYEETINEIAPLINQISKYIPKRRKRKLHIGLFGYSRGGSSIQLPRAITFCAALYSIGIPPEIFGLSNLDKKDIKEIQKFYGNFSYDMNEALKYYNESSLYLFSNEIAEKIRKSVSLFNFKVDKEHKEITTKIARAIKNNDSNVNELILRAANIRGFLG